MDDELAEGAPYAGHDAHGVGGPREWILAGDVRFPEDAGPQGECGEKMKKWLGCPFVISVGICEI